MTETITQKETLSIQIHQLGANSLLGTCVNRLIKIGGFPRRRPEEFKWEVACRVSSVEELERQAKESQLEVTWIKPFQMCADEIHLEWLSLDQQQWESKTEDQRSETYRGMAEAVCKRWGLRVEEMVEWAAKKQDEPRTGKWK